MKMMPKLIHKLGLSSSVLIATLAVAPLLHAQPFGQWDFNTSNLVATVGADLQYADGPGGLTATRTRFGTNTAFGLASISNAPATLMNFPITTNGLGYLMPTPAGNGGGGTVNEYTLLMDVFYPAASANKIRPLIQTENGTHLGSQQFLVINAAGAIAPRAIGPSGINGAGVGSIQTETWYRLGLVVQAGGNVRVYTNGVEAGSFPAGFMDGFLALDPGNSSLILADTETNSAAGYINSLQLRDTLLNAGQMAALGGPSAAGIPQVIPPVPSFIDSRTPGVAAAGISEEPEITVVLNEADTTVTPESVQLFLDGVAVGTVNPTPPTYTATYQVPPRLDPLSTHSLSLTWTDSVVGKKTNTWSFTVKNYQVITLPVPFYFEDFDSLTEDATPGVALPAGWSVQNQTATDTAGFDLNNRQSDSYKDWILITADRFSGWNNERTDLPTIVVNGTKLTSLASGNLMWAESDSRCGGCNGQFADLFTAPISCVGRSNVFVAFNSIYEQNQDNMNFMEYSVDGGVSWLPVLYMFTADGNGESSDILYYTTGPLAGTIDVTNTFARIEANRNWSPVTVNPAATNYGSYIKAPITTNLIPYMRGVTNDDTFDGKRVEVIRIPAADGKADVRFRANANGTSAWFWGIDNFGLYEITTPVFTAQPANATAAAGTTATFSVAVSSPTPVTYQWQHAGTNLSNGGRFSGVNTPTLTVNNLVATDAGAYRCKVTNASGETVSNTGTLTVVTVPTLVTQPNSQVVSEGYPVSFSGLGFGGLPLTYEWRLNGATVGSGTNLTINSTSVAAAGSYTLVITNSYGAITSRVARLSVVNVGVTNNLVVHLKFDGDYADSSGRGNHATPINGPALVAGKIGNALQFTTATGVVPDVTNFASLNYPADLQFGNATDFSVGFWVQYTQQSDDLALFSNTQWDSSGNPGWGIFSQGGGNFRVKVTGTGGTKADVTFPNIIRGTGWHHLLVVFQQGGAMYTLLDGALLQTTPWTLTGSVDTFAADYTRSIQSVNYSGAHRVNIGQDGTGWYNDKNGGAITNGLIDDVGIWRRAVSPQEALAIYTAGLAAKDLTQIQVSAPVSIGALNVTYANGNANFAWTAGTGIRLQKSVSLNPANWVDITSTIGAAAYTEPTTNGAAFYRLTKP